ncbi:MauE/DoxX family redox-associated membrane protein [Bacillus sp. BHET2]|uniref:MauE/DoxX family redox-associated membrane protein n=1 Tax=Bacillus sp. BHET2 TaxID=2583818 RepID=UPI0014864059|nr:MauE/DoxX family redox-associated membrane protein [Bacillus sp. BHET2]
MELLVFKIVCLIFGYIFVSTGLSKLYKKQEHISSVYAYQVIPLKYVIFFSWMDITLEILLGILLITGTFLKISLVISSILLMIYTLAILVNLRKGRTEIDCGCSGVLGNHKISYYLVIRNVTLITILLWSGLWALLSENAPKGFFVFNLNYQYIVINSLILLILILYSLGIKVFETRKFLKTL